MAIYLSEGAARFDRWRLAAAGSLIVALLLSLVDAPFARDQLLQHVPTALALAALVVDARRHRLSRTATFGVATFLLLHIVGARWVYSAVPYAQWCDSIFGSSSAQLASRNQFDRLVHLCFGALFVLPIAELCARPALPSRRHVAVAVLAIGMASALYEVFEWLLTWVAAGEAAVRYNGQQGDPWDAQKDMALALVGALVAAPILMWHRRTRG